MLNEFRDRFKQLLYIGNDAAPEEEVIEGIIEGTSFAGAKLWILVLAIFVASLGLNTNSTAVIIGAMLISPLMGPIIGLGLSAGINDFELMKRCFRNYLIATIFSVVTAMVYFLLTPIAQAQSELLARTSPSFYDVLIALCGGLAGIIALSSKSQRNGNVIPGVAIATALMPPLCTVGFGLATANWTYALGALYLYIINTIFIASATFIGATFIIGFKKKTFVDKKREVRVRNIITVVTLVTTLPAIWLTLGMVRQTVFEQHVESFIQKELNFDNTRIVGKNIDYKNKSFSVMLIGEEVDTTRINDASNRLEYYDLNNVHMQVLQNVNSLDLEEVKHMLQGELSKENQQTLALHNQIMKLEEQLKNYHAAEEQAQQLRKEMGALFPQIQEIGMGKGWVASNQDDVPKDTTATLILLESKSPLKKEDKDKMVEWLHQRMEGQNLKIVFNENSQSLLQSRKN